MGSYMHVIIPKKTRNSFAKAVGSGKAGEATALPVFL